MCESRLQRGEEKFSMLRDKIVSARMKMLVFIVTRMEKDRERGHQGMFGVFLCF